MSEVLSIDQKVGLYLDCQGSVSYSDIKDFLEGMDASLNLVIEFLKEIYPDVGFTEKKIKFSSLKAGSVESKMQLFTGLTDDDIVKAGENTRKILRMNKKQFTVLVLIVAIMAYSGIIICPLFFGEKGDTFNGNNNIKGDNNNFFNINLNSKDFEELGLTQENTTQALNEVRKKFENQFKKSANIIQVAKDNKCNIRESKNSERLLTKKQLATLNKYEDVPNELVYYKKNIEIILMKLNYGKNTTGWSGKLKINDKDIHNNDEYKLIFDNNINIENIKHRKIFVDCHVTVRYNEKNEIYEPDHVLITRIVSQGEKEQPDMFK
ncbi:hypothetical protein AAEX28_02355 [Lentisphaerota bacterium WC36G]|nr:hypothetical protein LJT99_05240 [Lentisphaerae bacterium WC36]